MSLGSVPLKYKISIDRDQLSSPGMIRAMSNSRPSWLQISNLRLPS